MASLLVGIVCIVNNQLVEQARVNFERSGTRPY